MPAKRITLALQGGGSHGAFTWGVLDRLLAEPCLEIAGTSGASAGAVNAVLLAHGHAEGGRDGARRALEEFWRSIACQPANVMPASWSNPISAPPDADPAISALLFFTRFFSPRELNPLDHNPLRAMLARQVDFERLRTSRAMPLFVAATRVSTGRPRLFTNTDITLDALLASACIPTLNRAVEIEGEAYWDGGLTANPPLRPLVYRCEARDLLLVLLDPSHRPHVPSTADEIARRLTEISFSAALFADLEGIALAKQAVQGALLPLGRLDRRVRHLNLHVITPGDLAGRLGLPSRLSTHAGFIEALREAGFRRADAWLAENREFVGRRSTFEFARFLG